MRASRRAGDGSVSTTRLRLHVGIVFVGWIRPEKGRRRGGGDAEETPDECDLLPLSGHSWARAGQVQSAGDQRKFQQNSQKCPGVAGFCLSIDNDYGLCSILKPLGKAISRIPPFRTRTPEKFERSVECRSDKRGVIVTWSASLLRPVGTV